MDDASDAIRVLADRVGASVEGNQAPLDAAVEHLSGQRLLLLIDNFEQILEAGPDLAALLDACPGVSALVTSRRPLRLRGERQMTVEPLGLPEAGNEAGNGHGAVDEALRSPAVALFVERAQRVRPGSRSTGATSKRPPTWCVGWTDSRSPSSGRGPGAPLEPGQMLERLERGHRSTHGRRAATSRSGSAPCARHSSGATTC